MASFRPVIFVQFVVHFMLLLDSLGIAETRNLQQASFNRSIPAIFVFGDSTVDSGNNNYIPTIAKSNFQPYGKDFPDGIPTGRFTNGKLYTDFLVSYMGIKDYIPPYLDPTLTLDELQTGVCFASAGTGYDPLTAKITGVISMEKQLSYFQEYVSRMENYIGKERTETLISKSMFFISAGTNDFILNYYGPPIRSKTYTVSAYQEFISQLSQQFIESLLKLGARKIVFLGLPPIGCVPLIITLKSNDTFAPRGCIEELSSVARDYNRLLLAKLATTIRSADTARIVYVDAYKPLDDMIKNPQQFGFENVDRGCCGSGLLELSILCNRLSPVCSDDSEFLFWDSAHPTEAAYYIIFEITRPLINQFFPKD